MANIRGRELRGKGGPSSAAGPPRPLLLAMLLLGFAVVFWGLHDKVSLYKHTGAAPPVAKAKLLSGREAHADLPAPGAPTSPTPAAPVVLFLGATFLRLFSTWKACRGRGAPGLASPPLKAPPFSRALRHRPPPVQLHAYA